MSNSNKVTVQSQYKKFPSVLPRFFISLAAILFLAFLWKYTVDVKGVSERGLAMVKDAIIGLLKPSWKIISDTSSVGLFPMLAETFAIAFMGTLIGTVLALPFAFLSSRNVAPKSVNYVCMTIIAILRAFPSFIYGIMLVRVVGPGAYAGALTMAISSIGMLSKLISEAIEDINPGIIEALDAAGCSTFEKVRIGIIPQLSSNIISIIIYRLDINVKSASILGVVGAGGIGAPLLFAIARSAWDETSAMLLGLVILVLVLEYVSTKLRSKLANG